MQPRPYCNKQVTAFANGRLATRRSQLAFVHQCNLSPRPVALSCLREHMHTTHVHAHDTTLSKQSRRTKVAALAVAHGIKPRLTVAGVHAVELLQKPPRLMRVPTFEQQVATRKGCAGCKCLHHSRGTLCKACSATIKSCHEVHVRSAGGRTCPI